MKDFHGFVRPGLCHPHVADAEEKAAEAAAEQKRDGKSKKRDNSSGTVYMVDGKQLKPVSVQLGITDNRNTEVTGGDLKPGDKVVSGDKPAAANKPSSVGTRLF